MLGATGAVECIACILALENNTVPPTIHYTEPDPELDLDYTPNKAVQTELELAICSNLGFGGHNACVAFKKV
jgi:3-oxoacyl-[acyl-carrier-protein] synthase II